MIPQIEMQILDVDGHSIENITPAQAKEQVELGYLSGPDGDWEFDLEGYLEKMRMTRFANAVMLIHKGCEGAVSYYKGILDWEQSDAKWFDEFITNDVMENKWLGNMSTKELADRYEEVQRELEMEKDNE